MSSPQPPKLTNRAALDLHRARSRQDAMFLHHEALAELEDRLAMVNRAFTAPAIVTGHPDAWTDLLPQATLVPDTDTLPLDAVAHDLVVHTMSLHWANDPVGQLIQCRRALKPDGLFLGVLFGGQTLHELRACVSQAETQITGGLSPRVLPMGDIRDLGALLQRAGFALPVADSLTVTAEYDDMFALMRDLRGMGESNAMAARVRHLRHRDVLDLAAEIYATHFPGTQKALRATFELITLTGWAPADSQPQPLRPGSASARLADALGTDETSLPD